MVSNDLNSGESEGGVGDCQLGGDGEESNERCGAGESWRSLSREW